MSTWFDEAVTCPACGVEQTARLARGIHVSRAPEAREQVFDRTFHRVKCTACSVRFVAKRPLVYTDMDRKHWIQVALADERPRWPELESLTDQVFERAFTGSPLVEAQRDSFKVRLVFGIEELREKLVIWRAGFDDAIVEVVKLRMFAVEPGLSRAHRLLVDELDDRRGHALCFDADERPTRTVEIPRALLSESHDDFERMRRRLPELFGGRFVSTHRLLGHRYRWATPAE
ncbi:MAG TPA: CpXC domain-containing protein [Kofleriaceae bacterium]